MPVATGIATARYDSVEYDSNGYDSDGYDMDGYNSDGYNRDGYDSDGYDSYGYNSDGYASDGYDSDGYNRDGYDMDGYNSDGYDSDGYDSDGYDRNGFDRDGESNHRCYCDCCAEEDSGLESYNYTPELYFRGDSGPYYGMEIEITTDHVRSLVEIARARADGLVYCKSDSSVDGAEMVTHPMSYEWAMAHFPWDILPEIKNECDATVIPQENGIHVHVGRDGFSDSAHMYRWMKLWYRNPRDIERIARRRTGHWSGFDSSQRAAQKDHVKQGKRGYRRSQDGTLSNRYAAINTTNDATLEVRVFASTLRPQRAKAALQLVAASVEYTRTLDADAITHRHGWDWPAFMAWTAKSGQYPDLVAENRIRRPV